MQFSAPPLSKKKLIFAGVGVIAAIASGVASMQLFLKPHPDAHPALIAMKSTVTLSGRGDLQPFHVVSVSNPVLQNMVKDLSAMPAPEIFTKGHDVDMKIADILFRWADSDMVQRGAYGPYIDARVAGFLKKIGAVPASYAPGSEIPIKDATNLTRFWFEVFDRYRIRLLSQTAGQSIYDGGTTYNINTDTLTVNGPIAPAFIKSFQKELQKSDNSGEQMHALLDYINATKGFDKLTDQEQDLIMSLEVRKPHAPMQEKAQADAVAPEIPGKGKPPAMNATP